jgi:hypothetical protein
MGQAARRAEEIPGVDAVACAQLVEQAGGDCRRAVE